MVHANGKHNSNRNNSKHYQKSKNGNISNDTNNSMNSRAYHSIYSENLNKQNCSSTKDDELMTALDFARLLQAMSCKS